MINLKNEECKIDINSAALKKDAQEILNIVGYSDFGMSIMLCDNHEMQYYNKKYRDKDKVTDILSFSFHPKIKPGEQINPKTEDERYLGDLIIAPAYVKEDCKNWNQTFEERMRVLLVHGVCHLLGYDHETDEEYAQMKEKEDWILKHLKPHIEQ